LAERLISAKYRPPANRQLGLTKPVMQILGAKPLTSCRRADLQTGSRRVVSGYRRSGVMGAGVMDCPLVLADLRGAGRLGPVPRRRGKPVQGAARRCNAFLQPLATMAPMDSHGRDMSRVGGIWASEEAALVLIAYRGFRLLRGA
jgi:hypothetical protein